MDHQQIARNKLLQEELYGEPLSDIVARIAAALETSQAKLAEVLGLSPAMLSQLGGGQRVKIGNPAVVERMRALDELAHQRREGLVSASETAARVDQIRTLSGAMSRITTAGDSGVPVVRALQAVLRAVASADELVAAAKQLERNHPGISEVLRVYGAGRTDAAVEHYSRIRPLL